MIKPEYYVVVDLEATCFDRNVEASSRFRSEIIEIGAVIVGADGFYKESVFSSFVKPACYPLLTDFCKKLTSIQQSDVDTAPNFPRALDQFLEWINKYLEIDLYVCCSWGPFDPGILKSEYKHHYPIQEYPDELEEWLDLSRLFTRKTGKRRGHRQAMNILKIEPVGTHHRGIYDAQNIAKMLPFLVGDK